MAGIGPIVVQAHAGPITAECSFFLDAGCEVVVNTTFLGWEPAPAVGGGPPRASLGTFQLLNAFGARLRSAPLPAAVGAVRAASCFTLRLNAAAWSRILTELVLAGVFAGGNVNDYDELQQLMEEATIPNPANLHITDADVAVGQPFIIPAGAGAAAVETRRLLSLVRYLHLATVGLLEDLHSRSPWRALVTLVSCVGASLTSASRTDETSHIQDFAALFRARRPECTADGALARALRNIASDVRLPKELRPDILTSDALAEAAIDGLNYQSLDRRPGIEERRVSLLVREVTPTQPIRLAVRAPRATMPVAHHPVHHGSPFRAPFRTPWLTFRTPFRTPWLNSSVPHACTLVCDVPESWRASVLRCPCGLCTPSQHILPLLWQAPLLAAYTLHALLHAPACEVPKLWWPGVRRRPRYQLGARVCPIRTQSDCEAGPPLKWHLPKVAPLTPCWWCNVT